MLRPLLVRPLVQTFAMIVLPSESEINKTWQAQVVEPFQKTLAGKYPFAPGAQMQATPSEIGQVFGPEGAVAKFVGATMGPLVVRRGDVLSSRTWADIGVTLAPQVVSGFPGWVAPLSSEWRGLRRRPADRVPAAADDRARRHGIHDRDRRPAAALPEYAAGLGEYGASGTAGGQRGQGQRRHFRWAHRGAVQ
jgi:hypothetical protein